MGFTFFIGSLPNEINKLLKLEVISLSINSLNAFNLSSASKMKHLRTVNISHNRLKHFPVDLCMLPNVDAIDVSYNLIVTLPGEIKDLKAMELNLNRNRLNALVDSISQCERLKVLRVEENCLPLESLTPNILKKSQISVLAFDGNLFDMKQFQGVEGYDEVSYFLDLYICIS